MKLISLELCDNFISIEPPPGNGPEIHVKLGNFEIGIKCNMHNCFLVIFLLTLLLGWFAVIHGEFRCVFTLGIHHFLQFTVRQRVEQVVYRPEGIRARAVTIVRVREGGPVAQAELVNFLLQELRMFRLICRSRSVELIQNYHTL